MTFAIHHAMSHRAQYEQRDAKPAANARAASTVIFATVSNRANGPLWSGPWYQNPAVAVEMRVAPIFPTGRAGSTFDAPARPASLFAISAPNSAISRSAQPAQNARFAGFMRSRAGIGLVRAMPRLDRLPSCRETCPFAGTLVDLARTRAGFCTVTRVGTPARWWVRPSRLGPGVSPSSGRWRLAARRHVLPRTCQAGPLPA